MVPAPFGRGGRTGWMGYGWMIDGLMGKERVCGWVGVE